MGCKNKRHLLSEKVQVLCRPHSSSVAQTIIEHFFKGHRDEKRSLSHRQKLSTKICFPFSPGDLKGKIFSCKKMAITYSENTATENIKQL